MPHRSGLTTGRAMHVGVCRVLHLLPCRCTRHRAFVSGVRNKENIFLTIVLPPGSVRSRGVRLGTLAPWVCWRGEPRWLPGRRVAWHDAYASRDQATIYIQENEAVVRTAA